MCGYFMWLKEKNRGNRGSLLRCYVPWNDKFSKGRYNKI